MALLLGVDVSTTATKALLADERGRIVAVASSSYDLTTPRASWAEQEPELWWDAAVQSIREALAVADQDPSAVAAVGLTGQMHGLVLLDDRNRVLRPAILWNDQRAALECELIRRRVGPERLVASTGNDAFPGFSAPKLLWVREHEPEIYARTAQVLLPKDYVRLQLTGAYATDRAGAGGTLLLDLETRDWSPEMLDALEISPRLLQPTHEGTTVTGTVIAAAADATGLPEGTPVVAGAGDQAAQAVGVGAVRPGIVALTLGTSGVVFAATDGPLREPQGRLHAFPHADAGLWHVMGVMLSAGGSLRWYRDLFSPGTDFESLIGEAADVEPGAAGVLFLPYLSGERTPHADPAARGAFTGLAVGHGRRHLTRAVLEGVAFGLADNLAMMRSIGVAAVEQVRISGGGARSSAWRRILADVLGVELLTTGATEGAAFGAALLAGVAAGCWQDVQEACDQAVEIGPGTSPNPDARTEYERAYRRFRELYPALRRIS